MKAKKKPVETLELAALGVQTLSRLKPLSYAQPKKEKKGQILGSVTELVSKLKTEAKVL